MKTRISNSYMLQYSMDEPHKYNADKKSKSKDAIYLRFKKM